MLVNYHTHTNRCGHAVGSDREYVEAAISAGYEILGFADHCPWITKKPEYVPEMRMKPSEVDGYFHSLEALKKEYERDIKIYIGFESEYCPRLLEAQQAFLAEYPLDYELLGQHIVSTAGREWYPSQPTADEERLKAYVDSVIEGIQTGRYLYVAHPDLIKFTGSDEIYKKQMRRLCEALKAAELPVEFNLLGFFEGRNYPDRRFLQLAKETGNSVIFGVDAHRPEFLLNKEIQEKAKRVCGELKVVTGRTLFA